LLVPIRKARARWLADTAQADIDADGIADRACAAACMTIAIEYRISAKYRSQLVPPR
jgi:hypothetical protein